MIKIAARIATNCSVNDLKNLAGSLKEEIDVDKAKHLGKKYILSMILEWEKKRSLQEPARIEMGRILNDLGLHDLAAALRLSTEI